MMQKKYYSQYTDYENYTMLANRELEVLKMKNSGMSNTEISEIMNIKYNTVVIYLTRIIQKIDGTFDYEKERMYRNSGAKKRRKIQNTGKIIINTLENITIKILKKQRNA